MCIEHVKSTLDLLALVKPKERGQAKVARSEKVLLKNLLEAVVLLGWSCFGGLGCAAKAVSQ